MLLLARYGLRGARLPAARLAVRMKSDSSLKGKETAPASDEPAGAEDTPADTASAATVPASAPASPEYISADQLFDASAVTAGELAAELNYTPHSGFPLFLTTNPVTKHLPFPVPNTPELQRIAQRLLQPRDNETFAAIKTRMYRELYGRPPPGTVRSAPPPLPVRPRRRGGAPGEEDRARLPLGQGPSPQELRQTLAQALEQTVEGWGTVPAVNGEFYAVKGLRFPMMGLPPVRTLLEQMGGVMLFEEMMVLEEINNAKELLQHYAFTELQLQYSIPSSRLMTLPPLLLHCATLADRAMFRRAVRQACWDKLDTYMGVTDMFHPDLQPQLVGHVRKVVRGVVLRLEFMGVTAYKMARPVPAVHQVAYRRSGETQTKSARYFMPRTAGWVRMAWMDKHQRFRFRQWRREPAVGLHTRLRASRVAQTAGPYVQLRELVGTQQMRYKGTRGRRPFVLRTVSAQDLVVAYGLLPLRELVVKEWTG